MKEGKRRVLAEIWGWAWRLALAVVIAQAVHLLVFQPPRPAPDLGKHAPLPFLHRFCLPAAHRSRYCCFSASYFSRMSMNSAPVMVSFSRR